MESPHIIPWTVATTYCHHGIPLSNGILGALVWFQRGLVFLTINRADYWDRRGGTEWTDECTWPNLRRLLEAGDFDAVRSLFRPGTVNGKEKRPTRLPLGRLEFAFDDGYAPAAAELDVACGEARVVLANGAGRDVDMRIAVLFSENAVAIDCPVLSSITPVPAYEFPAVRDYFQAFAIPVPRTIAAEDAVATEGASVGWVQELPEDPDIAVLANCAGGLAVAACELETEEATAETLCAGVLARQRAIAAAGGYRSLVEATRTRRRELSEAGSRVDLGDRVLDRMYTLGIYKMLGNSMPGRIAPTLQGPWVEEHRMPPWSGDYHFNINVQECLWPAYASGHHGSLLPLFKMLDSWRPVLAERARRFAAVDGGLQMSHACDDRGTTIGGFWTGAIDHANTSWVAQMMWLYYRYSGDVDFLSGTALPFLSGAFRVFLALTEETGDGLSLPVSVSPEYGGAGDDAWGANSSFFLTNVHFLCEKLIECHDILPDAPEYRDGALLDDVLRVQSSLPRFTTGEGQFGTEIYLWEGQPLAESHRHHSHLAAVYPFDMVDPAAEEYRELLANSYNTWAMRGMGRWTGWAMPWAAILHARFGNPEMAVQALRILAEVFTMSGYATRHNAVRPGFSQFHGGDIMQVEAAIAFSAAVLELFVQNVRGRIRLFAGIPASLPDCRFEDVWAEGGFRISGTMTGGSVLFVRIHSTRGGTLSVENPWAHRVLGPATVADGSQTATAICRVTGGKEEKVGEHAGDLVTIETEVGETILLRPVGRG